MTDEKLPLEAPTPAAYAEFFVALANARQLATEGNLDEARSTLQALADGRVPATFGHDDTATLAIELGLVRLAERELRLTIRDTRGTAREKSALERLAALYRELREPEQEVRVLERLVDADPTADRSRLETLAKRNAPPLGATPAPSIAKPADRARPTSDAAPAPDSESGEDSSDASAQSVRSAPAAATPAGLASPAAADMARFLRLFRGRGDTHARQWIGREGRHGYNPVERPLTRERLQAHLDGEETLGVYQVREDRTVVFFAIDLDATKNALHRARTSRDEAVSLRRRLHREGLRIRAEAAALGLHLLLEDSGYKGRHLWGFLENPEPMGFMRNFVRMLGRVLHPDDPDLTIECFPKQDRLKDGQLGNLIKLPLGIHLRSGRRAWLLDDDGRPADDPWPLLRDVQLLDRERILDIMEQLRSRALAPGRDPGADDLDDEQRGGRRVSTPPPPPFQTADFERDPEMSTILAGCPVMKKLVERGIDRRRLTHGEQLVIRHVLGHRPTGLHAVNHVFRRCPEIPVENHLKSILSGFPMSCHKIRKKVPDVTRSVSCNCEFRLRPDQYPTPLSHLDEAKGRGTYPRSVKLAIAADEETRVASVAPAAASEWARRMTSAQETVTRAARELREAERALIDALRMMPNCRIELPDGAWKLDGEGEAARPVWEPKTVPT